MLNSHELIEHDFNLPCHDNELSHAGDVIEKLKNKLRIIENQQTINDEIHTTLFEQIIKVLDYVGELSTPVFAIEEKIEEIYRIKFLHYPELAKKLWFDHYEIVHHPYTLLKNRGYKLLDELDAEYFKQYKKHPPNWKP